MKLQKSLPTISDSLRYVNTLNRIATLLYEKNIDSTFYYTKKASEIANRLKYAKGQADVLNNLGIFYFIKGNIQLGLRYFNEGNIHYRKLQDSSNIVQTLMNIAILYEVMGREKKSSTNYNLALELGKKISHDSIFSLVIYNYIIKYPNKFSKDSLDYYLNKGRNIAAKYKDKRILLAYDQLTADNYIKNNQFDKGMALLKQANADALKNNLSNVSVIILTDMGDQMYQRDKLTAIQYYKQGLTIAIQKGYLVDSELLARKLAAAYAELKDYYNAYLFSKQYQEINDKIDAQENLFGIDYQDFAAKEQQLESSNLLAKYQSRLLILAIVISVMAIVMMIILWRSWKSTQKSREALRLQFQHAEVTMHDLETMNKNYARLIKIVAHDLRNPIGAVGAMTSMLAEKEMDEDDSELIELIQTSINNSLNLINDLLKTDFEQKHDIHKEETSFDGLLNECVQLLRFKAKDKRQQLIFNTDTNIKMNIDREKISRVINNLVGNAIKFSPVGSNIYINTKVSESGTITTVKDAGIGIPLKMQDKVFDPFTSARRKGTGGEQPFGLGLYISKQIIEAHHGKIWLKSEPDQGTEFFVELPFGS
ncbi:MULTISPECIES: tetratricopeptide repeat-containing sensor histidine kinase [unclassified Arcicella]|uniref:ATP-binding protein n=1 Tax=unclassified Arcicella TaxID=2644986 RepID=UPI002862BDA6|nr:MULTISPECIES: tetratricopeptide repeat-containing sensor histidine kinase [unclassified Arcicella]MDR6562791.1 signal transduction histidine kinase [Arcicella sp. BE51]MDR6812865.1 signal transduction histidine kinase [Arcicella sp. BE140]MDR6824179.1 signal transduction histidine kinase [Arcicella sp. BE139]